MVIPGLENARDSPTRKIQEAENRDTLRPQSLALQTLLCALFQENVPRRKRTAARPRKAAVAAVSIVSQSSSSSGSDGSDEEGGGSGDALQTGSPAQTAGDHCNFVGAQQCVVLLP